MGSAELLSRCEQAVQHYPIKEFKDAAARDGLEHHNSRETVFADFAVRPMRQRKRTEQRMDECSLAE
jgi:hypothetical protein